MMSARRLLGRSSSASPALISLVIILAIAAGLFLWTTASSRTERAGEPLSLLQGRGRSPGANAGVGPTTQEAVASLQARLRGGAEDGQTYLALGSALLQRVRETGDPALYDRAGQALDRARALDPEDPGVLVQIGVLQLARHEFAAALETGRAALAMDDFLPAAEG
ncbi:MAG: hypothetical protein ACR2JZ_04215, partial [Candidatus Limnocylindrales bacterium]